METITEKRASQLLRSRNRHHGGQGGGVHAEGAAYEDLGHGCGGGPGQSGVESRSEHGIADHRRSDRQDGGLVRLGQRRRIAAARFSARSGCGGDRLEPTDGHDLRQRCVRAGARQLVLAGPGIHQRRADAPECLRIDRWNGNIYTADCANFNSTTNPSASDLLLSRAGVLLGYVDQTNTTHVTTTVPAGRSACAPGPRSRCRRPRSPPARR